MGGWIDGVGNGTWLTSCSCSFMMMLRAHQSAENAYTMIATRCMQGVSFVISIQRGPTQIAGLSE